MARILIVDDDTRVTDVIAHNLTAGGHQCHVITNGKQVTETLAAESYDLLILDVMLPGASGFEICRRVRQSPDCYTMPVIIITAMAGEEEVMHGLAQGADDYIIKPFDVNNLRQRAEALLRAHAEGANRDRLTSLPTGDTTKREIQRRAIAHEPFVLGYAELVGIREFGYQAGQDAREKAIRHFARVLKGVGSEIKSDKFFVGHMGGGHFVCLLPPETADWYCNGVRKIWQKHLHEFYASVGQEKLSDTSDPAKRTPGRLEVLFCLTSHSSKQPLTPQSMFEVLSNMRLKAHAAQRGGVYMDKRLV